MFLLVSRSEIELVWALNLELVIIRKVIVKLVPMGKETTTFSIKTGVDPI
jgi:hypothetical protein